MGRSVAARNAWKRAVHGLPQDAPARVLEMSVQAAALIMKEKRYAGKCPEDWKPADWDRALRDTIKLRSDLMKTIAVEMRAFYRGRAPDSPTDPKHGSRAAGVLSLVRGGASEKPN